MAHGKAKAREIIADYGIDSPEVLTHLEELCWSLGAAVRRAPMNTFEARLTMSGERGIITVADGEKFVTRTRYSIAHELGHFLLHRTASSGAWCGQEQMNSWFGKLQEQQREQEANEFASELLLPETLLRKRFLNAKPNFKLVSDLADEFQTSFTSTARRLIELTEEAVALVNYTKEGVRWFLPSNLFKEQGYWINQGKLDSYTLAFDARDGNNSGAMESVDVTAWFEVRDWLQEETVKEQTRFFRDLGFGLSIVWIDNPKLIWK